MWIQTSAHGVICLSKRLIMRACYMTMENTIRGNNYGASNKPWGGFIKSSSVTKTYHISLLSTIFSMLPKDNIKIMGYPNPNNGDPPRIHQLPTWYQECMNMWALDCNAVATHRCLPPPLSTWIWCQHLKENMNGYIPSQPNQRKLPMITKWMTLSWITPMPYHMACNMPCG